MYSNRFFGMALLMLLPATPALAQTSSMKDSASPTSPIKLKWRFTPNTKFFVETNVNLVQVRRAESLAAEHRDTVGITTISSFLVKEAPENGPVVLEQKVESTRHKWGGTNAARSAAMAELFGHLQGAVFVVTLTPEHKVSKIEGYDELIKRIARRNAAEADRFRQLIPEEDLKRATEEGFSFLPDKPVKPGDQWTRPMFLNLLPMGTLVGETLFTFEKMEKGKALLKTAVNAKPRFQPQGDALQGGSSFELESRVGSVVFDVEKGRTEQQDLTFRFRGASTVLNQNAAGAVAPLRIDLFQEQTVTIRVRDRLSR